MGWHLIPSEQNPAWWIAFSSSFSCAVRTACPGFVLGRGMCVAAAFQSSSTSSRNLRMMGVGMTYPMLSAFARFWNARPTTAPSAPSAGPPLLPGLMAASSWMASNCAAPWA